MRSNFTELKNESSTVDQYTKNSLNFRVEHYKCHFFTAFFLLGIFNNNGYVLVQAGASSLAKTFDKQDFMGMF